MKQRFTYPHQLIAHRGGGTLAPENTLAAIREGHAHGYRAVEFDVMLAKENVAVLMHDDTLDRTTNATGALPDFTATQLAALDAGAWKDARFQGEPVPQFEAAAQLCVDLNIFANVEIKPYAPGGDAVARATGRLAALVSQRFWNAKPGEALLSSFSGAALEAARDTVPELPRAYLFDAVPEDWQAQLERLDCVALHCNGKKLTPAQAAAIKTAGYGLMCWTVNDPVEAKRLFDCGVDAICTDRLDLFKP
jgi:glycerophosphoryl diester phosphodiesterase